jgi:pimeloyl-ACP methyl ester carboxylesterase
MMVITEFLKLLTALNIKCVLAGNSLGGQIAWNTLEQPEMVRKILIDAAGYP